MEMVKDMWNWNDTFRFQRWKSDSEDEEEESLDLMRAIAVAIFRAVSWELELVFVESVIFSSPPPFLVPFFYKKERAPNFPLIWFEGGGENLLRHSCLAGTQFQPNHGKRVACTEWFVIVGNFSLIFKEVHEDLNNLKMYKSFLTILLINSSL